MVTGGMRATDLLAALRRTVEQLAAFNELAKALTSTLETREVLGLVMQKVSLLLILPNSKRLARKSSRSLWPMTVLEPLP